MQKKFLHILDLGQNAFWQLLQETRIAKEEDIQAWQKHLAATSIQVWLGDKIPQESTYFQQCLKDLGLEYSIRDCSGLSAEEIENLVSEQDADKLHIACGFSEIELAFLTNESTCTWFNGVSQFAAPWQAMAEAAFTMDRCESLSHPLDQWRICWMGKISPLAQSLMQVGIYVPYELFMGVPPWGDPDHSSTDLALKAGAKVFMSREPRLAIDDAHIIYVDTQLEDLAIKAEQRQHAKVFTPITGLDDSYKWQKGFVLDESFLSYATSGASIVSTDVHQDYAKADAQLQAERKKRQDTFLLATLYHTVTAQ